MDVPIRKRTLRLLSNGIYVVTSSSGAAYGAATVTWLSQASFKPPLVMAAIRPDSGLTGAPILQSAAAFFECAVRHIFTLGDHAVVVMEVVEAECRGEVQPLTVAASPWQYGG